MSNDSQRDLEKELVFTVDKQVKDFFEGNQAKDDGDETPNIPSQTVTKMTSTYSSQLHKVKSKLIFLDYKSDFFTMLLKEIGEGLDSTIIKEFEELPEHLKSSRNVLLFLNYSVYPKLCQQMIPLVKEKFSHAKMIIVAKNLTAESVKQHKASEFGVDDYLSFPFTREDFFRVLLKYNS